MNIKPSDFDYPFDKKHIANAPEVPRHNAKLMVIDKAKHKIISHTKVLNIDKFLNKEDVLVFNNTKVFPARLFGKKVSTGGKVEFLLLEKKQKAVWEVLTRPGLKQGQEVDFGLLEAKVLKRDKNKPNTLVEFDKQGQEFFSILDKIGHTPIPPYIKTNIKEQELREKYQTVYAKLKGSVAAPTAGLHFTKEVFENLKKKQIKILFITLHVGIGTFGKVDEKNIETKTLHTEKYFIDDNTANLLNKYKDQERRIIAVGTTTTRALESNIILGNGKIIPGSFETNIFIYPPFKFKFIDGLFTNFHLPKSSLSMMVSSFLYYPNTEFKFTGFKNSFLYNIYVNAQKLNYRFFSFGDAMLII